MSAETLVFLILIVFVIGALLSWPYTGSWGYKPVGVLLLLLVIFLVWTIAGGRPLFRSSGGNIETTIQDAGHEIKSTGRDVADAIRDAVN